MTLPSRSSSGTVLRPALRHLPRDSAFVQRRIGQFQQHLAAAFDRCAPPRSAEPRLALDRAELERLTSFAAAGDHLSLSAAVNQKRRLGQSHQQICLVVLTAVARRLGEWWDEDRCGFVEVTLGMLVLHQLLRELGPGLRRGRIDHPGRIALMLPLPGDQHSFGIAMVAEFFRAAGWQVSQDGGRGLRGLLRRVGEKWFGLVALSCSVKARLAELPQTIAAIRAHALNPHIAIMVGGPALAGNPALAASCGADATATDAAEALQRAERLVALMPLEP
ncbi:MAG: cobalamin B12-binding domain-containing protein [Roseococcus sp.]|nr:cobalamin B12-binding domain-containing protein [Roseococcus sp.]